MRLRSSRLAPVAFTLLAALALPLPAANTYTYPELVKRLTDLRELAKLPPAGETTSLASSYDRRSRYDDATDKYIQWDANRDGTGIVRTENGEAVLADIQGPGCIWRTWSATAGHGHVKIYLDGADTPTVDLPFIDYFSGKAAPFNRPNLVYGLNGHDEPPGYDNYTPIPFGKSCRIVGDKDWGNYYQFTYTRFPDGTIVPTFSMDLSKEDAAALDAANAILGQCGQSPLPFNPIEVIDHTTTRADPGSEAVVADLSGPAAITALKVKLDLPADAEAQRALLRQLTISITWDDEKTPAVWSPLGDFFGFVGGARPYRSLPLGLSNGVFYSYWYMPFSAKAHIVVGNDGPAPVSLDWRITHVKISDGVGGLARFHAKWHRDAFLPERADRKIDWTLLTTQGRGRYVGTHLHGWNPEGGWWGEGDDKVFVDGEKFPSSFGTGSEDYFGYAWSSEKLFSRPYHNQILNEGNAGHFDDNRWHIPDAVPFQQSLEAAIEKYFSNAKGTLYAAEVYWYLNADGTDPYQPVPVSDRVGYWVRPAGKAGLIEGESLQASNNPTHPPTVQDMQPWGGDWSGNHQLFWQPGLGESLDLPFPVAKAGRYRVVLQGTAAPDYGIVQPSLDGQPAGAPVDFYALSVTLAPPTGLGVHDLTAGQHTLTIAVSGKNDASTNLYFGLDYLQLVPAP